jgi:S-adenosylmethionine/arginine decarboxylase-like enzyme
MIDEINLAVVDMKIPDINGDGDEPIDVTSYIINPNFDPEKGDKATGVIEGWTTSAMNGYKQNTVSYNRAAITLYQDLVGLTPGRYKVTVHTYYRAGYYNEEWERMEKGEETHLTTLYAATADEKFETKVMNLYEDAADDTYGVNCYTLANGKFAPDGTSSTVAFFNQGHYLNELEFVVGEDGKARIGLEKTEILANDYEVVGGWHLYYLGKVEDESDPVDMSTLIINNDFDPEKGDKGTGVIEGWTTSAMNGYKQNTVSYNRAAITLYQDLVGLPEGQYEVTVHTYYRAGYYNEEWERMEKGEETHLTTLYAATADERYETKVMNLYEDAADDTYGVNCYTLANGKFAPDGTSSTVEFFNQGHYLNKLQFYVGADGKARIGLEKTEILANDYEVVGKWSLYYLGKGQGVETIETEAAVVATEIYTLDGIRISAPQQGINIFRIVRADGTVDVTKVLVR